MYITFLAEIKETRNKATRLPSGGLKRRTSYEIRETNRDNETNESASVIIGEDHDLEPEVWPRKNNGL